MVDDIFTVLFGGFAFAFVVNLGMGMGLGAMTWIRKLIAY